MEQEPRAKEIVDDITVIDTMIQYGGSFVSALGRAAQKADLSNLRVIKTAFAHYWDEYRELAAQRRR